MLPALRSRPRLATPARVALLVPALFLAIALVFGTSAAPATTADLPLQIEEVTSIGGRRPAVAFGGSYAYVVEGTGLTVLDISNSEQFVRVGHLGLENQINSLTPSVIHLFGSLVFIGGDSWDGLAIIDVSNPAQPTLLSRYRNVDVLNIFATGNRVYLLGNEPFRITGPYLLHMLDLSDPTQPTLQQTWPLYINSSYQQPINLFAAGQRIYITDTIGGLYIYDIQNDTSLMQLGTYTVTGLRSLVVAGDRAYLAMAGAGVQIIDVSDPAHPALLGSYDSPADTYSATQVRAEGDRVYVAATYDGFAGLQVFDMSNPANPMLLGSLPTVQDVQGVQALQVDNGWVSALSTGTWQIIDWRVANNPIAHGRYPIIVFANDIQVRDDHAYIATGLFEGFQILDISDLDSMMQLGTVTAMSANSLKVRDSLAYVTESQTAGGLHIIDIATETDPVQIGHYDTISSPEFDVQIIDNFAYLAAGNDGLQIIDISNPISPTLHGANATPMNTAFLQVEGQIAYALDNQPTSTAPSVLYAMDVSDPSNPTILGTYQDAAEMNWARGMDIANGIAYITTGESLQMIDVSDPAHLTRLGSYVVPASGVRVVGTYAYVFANNRLDIIDASDPAHPELLGSHTSPAAYASDIEVVGDLVYIAAGWHGMYILRVVDPADPTPTPTIGYYLPLVQN
jgi:hypothetical protein